MQKKISIIVALASLGLFAMVGPASAADECTGSLCGTPKQVGGGGCGCGGGSIKIANTDEGVTYQDSDDYDGDGIEDIFDNCRSFGNKSQVDGDGDGIGDACDICPSAADAEQVDVDGDGSGDACDSDIDNDGVENAADNCKQVANPTQTNSDSDGEGNACDLDDDQDGVPDITDNCPLVSNPGQGASDPDSFGDACDKDEDNDDIPDALDNCPGLGNVTQVDADGDGAGDACDSDIDNDLVLNNLDNCPGLANPEQADGDRDLKGDSCDARFCYIADPGQSEESCLDPLKTFSLYSPKVQVKTGEDFRLRLFANRQNSAIRYKWLVTKRPEGSTASVINPQGTVRLSNPFEYLYKKGNVPMFTPDVPGDYEIEVVGELVFPDAVNENWERTHSYVFTISASGESEGGGCAVGQGQENLLGFVTLLGLLTFIRRRQSR